MSLLGTSAMNSSMAVWMMLECTRSYSRTARSISWSCARTTRSFRTPDLRQRKSIAFKLTDRAQEFHVFFAVKRSSTSYASWLREQTLTDVE